MRIEPLRSVVKHKVQFNLREQMGERSLMTNQNETPAIDWRVRERLADQLLAIMNADWSRLTREQMLKVLLSAQWKIEAQVAQV